jgi:hypothetical protein
MSGLTPGPHRACSGRPADWEGGAGAARWRTRSGSSGWPAAGSPILAGSLVAPRANSHCAILLGALEFALLSKESVEVVHFVAPRCGSRSRIDGIRSGRASRSPVTSTNKVFFMPDEGDPREMVGQTGVTWSRKRWICPLAVGVARL